MPRRRHLLPLALLASTALAQADGGLARGWFVSGQGAAAYEVSTVEAGACGQRAGRVQATSAGAAGPVAVLQTFRADDYRGARLRFSATVDAEGLTGWAGLFFRADAEGRRTVAFDDMSSRPVRGTRRCARVFVVADVPADAALLSLGVTMEGPGALEFSDIALDRVPSTVPLTSGVDQVEGRVGLPVRKEETVLFNATSMVEGKVRPGGLQVTRRSPGVWGDDATAVEARVEGDRVKVRVQLAGTGAPGLLTHTRVPLVLTGDLGLRREGEATVVEGTLGAAGAAVPARIEVTPTRLELRWGTVARRLVAVPTDGDVRGVAGCRRYQEATTGGTIGSAEREGLVLCGGVLSPTPPPAQTVLSLVVGGLVASQRWY